MKKPLRLLVSLVVVATALAYGQSASTPPMRVVVMPFDANASVATYQLGLPTALQRALNEIPGVFVPAVGDPALIMQKAHQAGKNDLSTIESLFKADAVVQGTVNGTGSTITAQMTLVMGGKKQTLTAQATDGTPATLARSAAKVLAQALRPDLSAAILGRVDEAAAQTPSLPSLGPVALAASRLPGARSEDLATATQLDPKSAWVQAEYARLLALDGHAKQGVSVAQQAVKMQPDDVEAQVVLGVVLDAANQQKAAEAAFQKAIALNPADAVALTGLAGLETDKAKASQQLEAAIRAYPRMLDAYLELASLQTSGQRKLQTLRNAEASMPESLALHQAIVQQVVKMGDGQGALSYLQQAVKDPMASSAGLYALARLLPADVASGALALVKQGEKAYPNATILKVTEGELLVQQADYAQAESVLKPLHGANPKDSTIANLLAVAQARQGEVDAARKTFESVAGTGPTAEVDLAKIYLAAGRAEAARQLLDPLAGAGTKNAQALAYHGLALARIGQLAQAKAELEQALKLQPKLAIAQRGLSFLQQQKALTGGQQVAFTAEAGRAFQQGIFALEVQDYPSALKAFEKARKLDDNGLAAFFEGYALQLTGKPRAAVADYQTALKSFPNSDIVLNDLGYAHLQLGRYDLALQRLGEAIKANPQNAQAHLNLGLTYYALGRYKDALGEFDQAVKLDPSLASSVAQVRKQAQQKAGGQ